MWFVVLSRALCEDTCVCGARDTLFGAELLVTD